MSEARIRGRVKVGAKLAIVFVCYVATAQLGLSFDALSGVATTVWPPTGIALAALILGGMRYSPAIALAAFLVNVRTGIPFWAAALIAVGNTLEAVIGAGLLRRFGFDSRLARLRDVLLLVGLAALGSTIASATFGLTAAALAGLHPAESFPGFWAVWWVGDAMGDILIAPLILTWASPLRLSRRPTRWIEGALLAVALTLMCLVVFRRLVTIRAVEIVRGTYAIVPLLIWAALRFEQRGTTAALVFVSVMAVSATTAGRGLFSARTPHEQLLMVQSYMAVTATSMLTLAAALAERRAAIAARDEFISIASHELKTPLTALKLRLDSAAKIGARPAEGRAGEGEDKLGRALVAANTTTDRLVSLVDNLLDVSRVHAARLVLRLEPVALRALLIEVAGRLREHAAETGSTIVLDVPDEIVGIWDRSRMEQVVTNLLTNAIKYGEGRPIGLSVRRTAGGVQLRVRDRGIGISRSDQSRIFRAFERVATGRRVGGLGLGLYIGQQIAVAHGGALSVESESGRGATFVLDMPLGASKAPPSPVG